MTPCPSNPFVSSLPIFTLHLSPLRTAPSPPRHGAHVGMHAGQIISQILLILMMRKRRLSKIEWRVHETSNGKHWIEQVCPSNHLLLAPLMDRQNMLIILFPCPSLPCPAILGSVVSPTIVPPPHDTRRASPFDDWIPPRQRQFVVRHGHGPRA